MIRDVKKIAVPFVNVVFKAAKDSSFVIDTVTNDEGRFSLVGVKKVENISWKYPW